MLPKNTTWLQTASPGPSQEPSTWGLTHLLTMVDQTTRWSEAVPLSSMTSTEVARAFIATWVTRFGTPSDLSSDRGPQFTSELWNTVAGSLGVKLHRTTAYHPRANGLCKCFHHSVKTVLRASHTDNSSTSFRGSCWACELHPKRTFRPHLRNWSMDKLFGSQGISSPTPQPGNSSTDLTPGQCQSLHTHPHFTTRSPSVSRAHLPAGS